VKHQYAHHLDGKDLDALVALFTEDAVCEFGQTYGRYARHLAGGCCVTGAYPPRGDFVPSHGETRAPIARSS
jgi:hypothetical protein